MRLNPQIGKTSELNLYNAVELAINCKKIKIKMKSISEQHCQAITEINVKKLVQNVKLQN